MRTDLTWVACSRESAVPMFAGRRHLTRNKPDADWVDTLCGASGSAGTFRRNTSKPKCAECDEKGGKGRPVVTLVDPGHPYEHRGIHRRATRTIQIDRKWTVELDGKLIGYIRYRMITREHRTPGRMYVNRRWESPGWTYNNREGGRDIEGYSMRESVERLVRLVEGRA